MGDFVFKVKGLTAKDRAQWEKDNLAELTKEGYSSWSEEDKDRFFKNVSFKNKFGNRADYNTLKGMSPEKRDSLYLSSPDDDIENLQAYQDIKQAYVDRHNLGKTNDGNLIGNAKSQWNDFDKMLDEISPYYKRFKGTEYFPLDSDKKIELLSTFETEAETYGKETAAKKMAERIQDEVSENQPLTDKIWNGIAGMGANTVGGVISFAGNIAGGLSALVGLDRLLGDNQKEDYIDNLWTQFLDNPWTRYGDQVMKQGTLFTEDDPEKSFNQLEVIRTTEEQENLLDNIFSVNTIPELAQQSGFTVASMLEGYGLTALGNRIFNTMKYATMAGKLGATAETASNINKALQGINTWQRRYNAYVVPALVGQGEGALNALNTKQDYLEDAKKMIQEEQSAKMEEEVQKRLSEWSAATPLTRKAGDKNTYSRDFKEAERRIRDEVWKEYQPMYEDALKRAEENADKAALTNFAINSFINGAANTTLKATMFNGKVTEALKRSKVGKLFAGNNYTLDDAGNVVARELTKKRMAWNMAKEMIGEGLEEYSQDISDSFSRGAAENDLANYLSQRYNGIADNAIVDSIADNLGAAFAAAGRSAISKDAIQSGIYGALGQAIGTPNVNALLNKSTYTKEAWSDKSFMQKVNNIWRLPFIESYYNDKQENQDRRESAKVLNEWLAKGNNRERLTSLRGSLGWAKSMQEASDAGDEFSYRNSRLGKQIQDYFMLEQLKGTPLYDAYVQRYMDILNAQEGDEMAQQIAQYDDRPLEGIKRDAQSMLSVMEKVQEATADLEKSLGNSIPQETKEALIYGKLSMEDWRERATQLEDDLSNIITDESSSNLSEEQKKYIARNGSITEPTRFDKRIEKIQTQIDNLNKNKRLLSESQKSELKSLNKQLKSLQESKRKATEDYQRLSEGIEGTPVLTANDIMRLNPVDRYRMLNPENRSKYSKEQQEIINSLIEEGTASTSDFMNKVEDAARINDAQMTFLGQYNAALRNPDVLTNIERGLKLTKRLEDSKKSYSKLNEIEDYSTFAEALDNALFEADPYEAAILDQTLKDNPLYQRYKKDDEIAEGIYNQLIKNGAFSDISEQDKDLVAAMTKFLSRRGVDISNYDEAVSALTSADENGKSNLTSYIESLNQKLPDNMKVSLENIGTLVNAYKKALESYKKNEEVKEEITRQPEEKPVIADKPTPNIFSDGTAFSSNEESGKSIAGEKKAEEIPVLEQSEEVENNNEVTLLSDAFINNNDSEVLEAAEKAINAVKNASSIYDGEARQAAIDAINSLGNKHYNSIEEFQDAVAKEALRLLGNTAQGGDINERTGSLLQQVDKAISKNKRENEGIKDEKETGTPVESTKQKPNISLAKINSNLSGFLNRKFKEWGVDDYLRSGKLSRKSGNKSTVYYAALDDITTGVKESMSQGSIAYSEDQHLPVLALVEDNNGPIVIGNKKYQPIGVLPRTELDSRAGKIRELAAQQPNKIVSSGNRKVTSSVIVASPPLTISTSKETDKDFATLIYEDLSPEDKAIIDDTTQDSVKRSTTYSKYLSKVAKRLFVGKDRTGKPTLYYGLPTMKGDGSVTEIPVLTKSLAETTSPRGKGSLLDVLTIGNDSEIIRFNSRTRDFVKALNNLVKNNNLTELTSDGTNFTGESKALTAIQGIDKILKRYLYSTSSEYSIRPAVTDNGLGLDLYLGEENIGRVLDSISKKEVTAHNMATLLSNLMMPNGTFRQGLNWQVDKDPSYYTPNTKHYKESNVINLIYDNILRVGIDRLEREISGVEISSPIAVREPIPANPSTTSINTDNSTSTSIQDIETSNTQSGERVNTDTGLTEKGNEVKNEITTAMEEARSISERIEADSKEIQLSEDGKTYVNTKTGKVYARVTSIIQADEQAGERFDPNSPWVTPSTNIGTGIDEFIRDFFAGKFDRVTDEAASWDVLLKYPNASGNQYNELRKQLQRLKNYLDAQGLTVIPRDIVATGTIQVTNSNGGVHEIPVAGTLDLLAYDREGNFYIFDMKTHHANKISEEKADKYSRQLSLYKQFLEGKYGIKVKSLNIIPIHVEYPAPNSHNKYSVSNGNQLMLNDKEYKSANPKLGEVGQIPVSPISIQYNKMTESEKALIESTPPTENKIENVEAKPEPQIKNEEGLTTGKVRTKRKPIFKKPGAKPINLESNPTSINFNNLSEEQQDALRNKYKDILEIEDYFNSWTEADKQHELDCLG